MIARCYIGQLTSTVILLATSNIKSWPTAAVITAHGVYAIMCTFMIPILTLIDIYKQ